MAGYLKKNAAPLVWFFAWIVLFPFALPALNTQTSVYGNLIYYAGLLGLVAAGRRRLFSRAEVQSLKQGRTWLIICLTILGLALAFALATAGIALFPHAKTGWGRLRVHDGLSLAAFAVSTIVMPPLAEELFFRKSLIIWDSSRKILFLSAAVSIGLFGLEHSLLPLGFMEGALIGVPLTVAYIRTKNILIPVTAHLIVNLFLNGYSVVGSMVFLLHR